MPFPVEPAFLVGALAAINTLTFLLFGWDKRQARRGGRRVPEARLLLLAALGGTPGAYAARRHFRHKTRKQPFVGQLHGLAGLQVVAIVALIGWGAG
ncbi:DUF1294 domain-containing protein [Novosphingobium mangrovi (ex Hu et al. 2023)]|uniref:DUF1294 domain-containing protein n=1 Tax=Novosphingobium mangrovi (ex Hu et al. 2023) TaxID=2930094 RepID=A0ABT0A8G3_9SPHN|nr:DUF1294 domain-containing protein [Novosphingobium mangrovi (ex Hu et al. 2023)]MCJ1959480.1 DUF1294 domain-containing protein [Novosphingobium mangrovi (ex Hu et al. 2023)]